MRSFKVGDVVSLRADVPGERLSKGQDGTIVLELTEPVIAYETEFADADGRTVAQLALLPEQLEAAADALSSEGANNWAGAVPGS